MPSPVQVVVQRFKGVTVVNLGDTALLDAQQIQQLADQLYQLIDKQDRRNLILDFSEVKLLSSSILGVLVTLRKKAEQAKGRLALCGLRKELLKVFRITKLHKLFEFYGNEEKALNSFGVSTLG